MKSRYAFIIYYLIIGFFMIKIAVSRPYHNWDMIAYAACAKSFEVDDPYILHTYAYEELKAIVPDDDYIILTAMSNYRATVCKDALAFYEQLPFYKIRIIPNYIIYLLSKSGMIAKSQRETNGIVKLERPSIKRTRQFFSFPKTS